MMLGTLAMTPLMRKILRREPIDEMLLVIMHTKDISQLRYIVPRPIPPQDFESCSRLT
jgi:hypothetical protein